MKTASEPFIHALLASYNEHKQSLHGKRVWLACSGGRDSLSLAMLCRQLFDAGQLPFLPQLLHVNHGMQAANDAWAEQVAAWAKAHEMSCQILSVSLTDNSEQSARKARYTAMIDAMNKDDVLIVGHHQDDQVETVLMRLFSGTGVIGLGGMQSWRYQQSTKETAESKQKGVYLWRPWLTISRQQITQYAKSQQLDYIDDPTNILSDSQSSHLDITKAGKANDRAWLRSVLMPRILEHYPQAAEAIARTSQLMQDASHIIDEQVQSDLASVGAINHVGYATIDSAKLQTLSAAHQSALIHAWLSSDKGELPPNKRLVEDVLALVARDDGDHQTCLYWDSGVHRYEVRRYQNKLYRLRVEWSQWLQIMPKTQRINCRVSGLLAMVDSLSLKPANNHVGNNAHNTDFEWCLMGLQNLVNRLMAELEKSGIHDSQPDAHALLFEPLPRDLKVALSGRVGRKSGKKLLQALNQPSFMRPSVVLCSWINFDDLEGDELNLEQHSKSRSEPNAPLFIASTDNIAVVNSEFSEAINELVDSQDLAVKVTRK